MFTDYLCQLSDLFISSVKTDPGEYKFTELEHQHNDDDTASSSLEKEDLSNTEKKDDVPYEGDKLQ